MVDLFLLAKGKRPRSQVFATPKLHHKSKPFFDHVINFCIADGRVWMRNYQASIPGGTVASAALLLVLRS